MIFVFYLSQNNPGRGCRTLIRVKESNASHSITISRDCSSLENAAVLCFGSHVYAISISKNCVVKDKDLHKG